MCTKTGGENSPVSWEGSAAAFVRGEETFSFEYDPAWLASADSSFSLDPDLALYRGRQYVPLDKRLFGLFADSCPDRWGRLLMKAQGGHRRPQRGPQAPQAHRERLPVGGL